MLLAIFSLRWLRWLVALFIVLFVLIIYRPTTHHPSRNPPQAQGGAWARLSFPLWLTSIEFALLAGAVALGAVRQNPSRAFTRRSRPGRTARERSHPQFVPARIAMTESASRRQNHNLAILNSLTASVSATLELPEVMSKLQAHLADQMEIPGGMIFLYEETKAAVVLGAAWGIPAAVQDRLRKIPVSASPYGSILQQKEPLLIEDFRALAPYDSWQLSAAHPDWRCCLCVPLLAKGEPQGLLQLFSPSAALLAPNQVALIRAIGQQVGIVVQNARLFEQIRTSRERLAILSQRFIQVQEAERRHIARELHDQVGQALTALKVNLQSIQRSSEAGPDDDPLHESIGMIDRIIQQVRSLSLDLRPSLLDDLGVVATIRWFIDRQARRAGFQAEVTAEPPELRLSPELETTCFRIVQEAITNVVRHAQASRVQVDLRQYPDGLSLVVWDDGVGFDVRAARERGTTDASLGLLGMEERALLVGGVIEIRSHPAAGQGTEIRVWFPEGRPGAAQQRPNRKEIE